MRSCASLFAHQSEQMTLTLRDPREAAQPPVYLRRLRQAAMCHQRGSHGCFPLASPLSALLAYAAVQVTSNVRPLLGTRVPDKAEDDLILLERRRAGEGGVE